jgi:hypothetical protein
MVYLTYEQNQKRNHILNLISETLRPFPFWAKVFNRIQTLWQGAGLYLHHRSAFFSYHQQGRE